LDLTVVEETIVPIETFGSCVRLPCSPQQPFSQQIRQKSSRRKFCGLGSLSSKTEHFDRYFVPSAACKTTHFEPTRSQASAGGGDFGNQGVVGNYETLSDLAAGATSPTINMKAVLPDPIDSNGNTRVQIVASYGGY